MGALADGKSSKVTFQNFFEQDLPVKSAPKAIFSKIEATQESCPGQGSNLDPIQTVQTSSVRRVLDLFSGTGSVSNYFLAKGYEVISLDKSKGAKRVGTFFREDIMTWNYHIFPRGHFYLIAAGPPCQAYSVANNIRPRDFSVADNVVRRTLEIIEYFQPELWWIENPRHGFLKHRDFMHNIPFIDIDYCQFATWGYKKPTRIWCCPQIAKLPSCLCNVNTCVNVHEVSTGTLKHRVRLGGYKVGVSTRQKGRMPEALIEYLITGASSCKLSQPLRSSAAPVEGGQARRREVPLHLYNLGKGYDYGVEDAQLTQNLTVTFNNGDTRSLKVLIDTGAQVNLISQKLVPSWCSRYSSHPVTLLAANGQKLEGG